MPTNKCVTVFQFDELSDKAKEAARDWYREGFGQDTDWADWTTENLVTVAGLLGIDIETRPAQTYGGATVQEPMVFWELHRQGAGACFSARLSYAPGAVAAVRAHAPTDTELHLIAMAWASAQRSCGYRAGGKVQTSRYTHSRGVTFEWWRKDSDEPLPADTETALEGAVRDLMDWYFGCLNAEWDYQNSADAVDDSIRANEYEFTANGKRYKY